MLFNPIPNVFYKVLIMKITDRQAKQNNEIFSPKFPTVYRLQDLALRAGSCLPLSQ